VIRTVKDLRMAIRGLSDDMPVVGYDGSDRERSVSAYRSDEYGDPISMCCEAEIEEQWSIPICPACGKENPLTRPVQLIISTD